MTTSSFMRPCGGGPTLRPGTCPRRASTEQQLNGRSLAAALWVRTAWGSHHDREPSRMSRAELPADGAEPGPSPPGAPTPIGASQKSLLSSFRDRDNLRGEKKNDQRHPPHRIRGVPLINLKGQNGI